MKKYTSVLMLLARATIYPLLGILLLAGLAETGLFYLAMSPDIPLDTLFQHSHIPLVCAAAFLLWTAVLSLPSFQKAGYTLHRISLTPTQFFATHAVYNALTYVILWGFQVCLLTALFHWFGAQADETMYGPQSILLAFYRADFLHSLLPLADWTRYLRNALLALGLGAVAAFPLARSGRRSAQIGLAVCTLLVLWIFPASMGSRAIDFVLGGIGAMVFGVLITIADTDEDLESGGQASQVEAPSVFTETESEVSEDAPQ